MGQVLRGLIGGVSKAAGQVADNRITRYTAERVAAERNAADQAKEDRIEATQKRAEGRAVTARRDEESYQASPKRIQQLIDAQDTMDSGLITSRTNRATALAGANAAEFDADKGTRDKEFEERLANARKLSEDALEQKIAELSNPELIAAQEAANPGAARSRKIALETAELVLAQQKAVAIIPPAEKLQYEALQADLEIISKAIAKAQAEGLWDAEEPSVIQQLEDRARISGEITRLLSPYMAQRPASATDALPSVDTSQIPQDAINDLKASDTPENREFFDEIFGAGSAASVFSTPFNPLSQGLIDTKDFSVPTSGRGAAEDIPPAEKRSQPKQLSAAEVDAMGFAPDGYTKMTSGNYVRKDGVNSKDWVNGEFVDHTESAAKELARKYYMEMGGSKTSYDSRKMQTAMDRAKKELGL